MGGVGRRRRICWRGIVELDGGRSVWGGVHGLRRRGRQGGLVGVVRIDGVGRIEAHGGSGGLVVALLLLVLLSLVHGGRIGVEVLVWWLGRGLHGHHG